MAAATHQTKRVRDNRKIACDELRLAFFMLDMVIGRSAIDVIVKELQRRGIMLYDANDSYSINEIKAALRITFSEDAVTMLTDCLKKHL